jgi:RNA polymerase-binding transcription factor
MSEDSELTPAIRTELKAALMSRQSDLRQQIADLRLNEITPEQQVDDATSVDAGDEGDASVDLQDRDDTGDLLLDLHSQLGEVEHALAKFENGTYGISERSGRAIPVERLRVVPEARDNVGEQGDA